MRRTWADYRLKLRRHVHDIIHKFWITESLSTDCYIVRCRSQLSAVSTSHSYCKERALSRAGLRVLRLTFLPAWLTNFVAACGLLSTFHGNLRRLTTAALGFITELLRLVTQIYGNQRTCDEQKHTDDETLICRSAECLLTF